MVLEVRGEAGVCGWPQGRLSTTGAVYSVWASFSKELKDLGEESCTGDSRRQTGGVLGERRRHWACAPAGSGLRGLGAGGAPVRVRA